MINILTDNESASHDKTINILRVIKFYREAFINLSQSIYRPPMRTFIVNEMSNFLLKAKGFYILLSPTFYVKKNNSFIK